MSTIGQRTHNHHLLVKKTYCKVDSLLVVILIVAVEDDNVKPLSDVREISESLVVADLEE